MDSVQQRNAARQFAKDWAGRGDEKQDAQNFWRQLLHDVYGMESPEKSVSFEYKVKNDQTNTTIFIDGYIHATSVLIEQKSLGIDLRKGYKQSDGSLLSPYQQARRYAGLLPHDMNPRWIVVSNFEEFHIHNMNRPNDAPEIVKLCDLEKEYYRLNFLVDTGDENQRKEMAVSIKAGELVGRLYDAFYKQYKDPESERAQKSLNALCVRLVFCLYAEDADIFGKHLMFHDYIKAHTPQQTRKALMNLFRVLDQKAEERDPYLGDDDPLLAAFPYVNGGLFSDEDIEIPPITEEIYRLLLRDASEDFDWSEISPTIFGAVFESTLNPETRRKGGMHYTSIENIHKVIDPLFLDGLKAELADIRSTAVERTRRQRLEAFHGKLAGLTFLDPAAGSGNFLTETYLSLRRLENQVILEETGGQITMGLAKNPIRVSIDQFYGIEINDFAVTVAKTALWIAESQMLKETEDIVHMPLDFLPLKTNATIVEGNSLRIDWNDVVPREKLNYIMGNPPFVGQSYRTKEQAADVKDVFGKNPKSGKLDYVAAWYKKAADYIMGTRIEVAFVSTNSISQGEQVAILWQELSKYSIIFAYRTFVWTSESVEKAAVHCVIIGFAAFDKAPKYLIEGERRREVNHINGYLLDGPDLFIKARGIPSDPTLPKMTQGNKPVDGGNLIYSKDERASFMERYPEKSWLLRRYIGSNDYINNKERYCLWLKDVAPNEYRSIPEIMDRIAAVAHARQNSPTPGFRAAAATPMVFAENRQPESDFLAVPEVSTERRRYIPIGYLNSEIVPSNKLYVLPSASLYMFGVMISNVHMAWMRTVCGRMKSDYSYSPAVYNNFPWPTPTDAQRGKIEETAQAILDARALYPDASLADLYDELTMPPELRTAHQKNDRAVMEAYDMRTRGEDGKLHWFTESETVAELMRRYQALTQG